LKCDYHNLIMLAFLQDLAKCNLTIIQGAMNINISWNNIPPL